jgi:hypothetical protein
VPRDPEIILRSYLVKDEIDDLLADFHNILNIWKNYYSVIECA